MIAKYLLKRISTPFQLNMQGLFSFSQSYNVTMANLSFQLNENDIKDYLNKNGIQTSNIKLLRDYQTKRSKGVCFVTCESQEQNDALIQLDGSVFQERKLKIQKSYTDEERKAQQALKICISNLPFNADQGQLEEFLNSNGIETESVRIGQNREGRPNGLAFVSCKNQESTQKLYDLNNTSFGERQMRVNAFRRKSAEKKDGNQDEEDY